MSPSYVRMLFGSKDPQYKITKFFKFMQFTKKKRIKIWMENVTHTFCFKNITFVVVHNFLFKFMEKKN